MKALYSRFGKSAEHRSDSDIKHMSILLAEKYSSDSSTDHSSTYNSASVLEIFLVVDSFSRSVSNKK